MFLILPPGGCLTADSFNVNTKYQSCYESVYYGQFSVYYGQLTLSLLYTGLSSWPFRLKELTGRLHGCKGPDSRTGQSHIRLNLTRKTKIPFILTSTQSDFFLCTHTSSEAENNETSFECVKANNDIKSNRISCMYRYIYILATAWNPDYLIAQVKEMPVWATIWSTNSYNMKHGQQTGLSSKLQSINRKLLSSVTNNNL